MIYFITLCINVLKAFFWYHHLLGVYFENKDELSSIVQDQISLFFQILHLKKDIKRMKKDIIDEQALTK